jgi:hypothetical protein
VTAPESLTVDVTPRRLQRFIVSPEAPWRVIRLDDGAVVQAGVTSADPLGVIAVPGVKVFRSGITLEVGQLPNVGVPAEAAPARPRIEALPSPLRSACTLAILWPDAGDASVTVLDVAGRLVRTVFRGPVARARQELLLDPAGLPNGTYFVRADQKGATAARRFAVMR